MNPKFFMTPAEQILRDKAILLLRNQTLSETDYREAQAYLEVYKIENSLKAVKDEQLLAHLLAWKTDYNSEEEQKKQEERGAIRLKCYHTVKKIIETFGFSSCRLSMNDMLQEMYSHPDCVAYYRTRENAWLMTTVIQNQMGSYIAAKHKDLVNNCFLYDCNGMRTVISANEEEDSYKVNGGV